MTPINPIGVASGLIDTFGGTPTQWGGMSPHLIGHFTAWDVVADNEMRDGPVIACPVTDVNLEMTMNWQSPFEQSGPESKAPTMMALLQSGQLGPIENALSILGSQIKFGNVGPETDELYQKRRDGWVSKATDDLVGKTGITKLNSTQVFSGMQPAKLSMTLHFRAISNPSVEVLQPFAQLLKWALPQELARNSTLANVIKAAPNGVAAMVSQMFPSRAPQLVCFKYANNRYTPMVIEHVSTALDGHLGITGLPLYRSVQIMMSTLTALDAGDVSNILSRGSFA